MKDFCQIEANKDTSYYSMRSIFSYAPMSFLRTEKRLLIVVWALEANRLLVQESPNTTILRSLLSHSPSTVKIEANSSVSSGSLSCDLGSKK